MSESANEAANDGADVETVNLRAPDIHDVGSERIKFAAQVETSGTEGIVTSVRSCPRGRFRDFGSTSRMTNRAEDWLTAICH
jgi:hypothetical protein